MIKNFNLNSNFLIYNAYTASCIPGLTDRLMMAGNTSQSEPATILHHGLIEDLVPALGIFDNPHSFKFTITNYY